MNSSQFLEAVAEIPSSPAKIEAIKYQQRKYEPTGRPATEGMLRLLASRFLRRGYKVSSRRGSLILERK